MLLILWIVNLTYTSVWLLLKRSNFLMIITLITVFCKLYVSRQNLDNFNILLGSLYRNMLHNLVVINNETSQLLIFSCIIKFYHYRFLVFADPFNSCCIYILSAGKTVLAFSLDHLRWSGIINDFYFVSIYIYIYIYIIYKYIYIIYKYIYIEIYIYRYM